MSVQIIGIIRRGHSPRTRQPPTDPDCPHSRKLNPFVMLAEFHPFFGTASAVPSKGADEQSEQKLPHLGGAGQRAAH